MGTCDTDTLIVGAGPAGLAVAACLRRAGIPFVILEQDERVGATWHRHYERLHLHTDKGHSSLPFRGFPAAVPRYPSREDFQRYLESYAQQFAIAPQFGEEVTLARREGTCWLTRTREHSYTSRHLVIATGYTRQPIVPTWPGQDVFRGPIVHSSAYQNGAPYQGQRVLVVGFGNSGGEIALDLWEHGAQPSMSVRGPVNVIPREVLGVPILTLSILLSRLPPAMTERLAALILGRIVGSYDGFGLRRAQVGPLTQIAQRRRIPLIDIGTMRLIREGTLTVYPGIERFTPEGVQFVDRREAPFDAIVLATGYRPALADFLTDTGQVLDSQGIPRLHGGRTALPGLYFCGFHVVPTGELREIGIAARAIARAIGWKREAGQDDSRR